MELGLMSPRSSSKPSRFPRAPLAVAAAALALLGLAGAAAQPAAAATHYIHMSSPARIPVGASAVINIDGVVAPPAEFWDSSWIEVVALPGTLMPECPGDADSAGSIAEEAGNILAIAMRPNTDEAGNFANSVALTAHAAGPVMICGYLYNEVGTTQAAALLRFEVVPASGDGGAGGTGGTGGAGGKPVSVRRPWVTQSGKRVVCHPGAWANASTFAYGWYVDGTLRRTTSRRPFVPRAYRGHRFACKVTASGPGGSASATSPTVRLR